MRLTAAAIPVRRAARTLLGTVLAVGALSACGAKDYGSDLDASGSAVCEYDEAAPSAGMDVELPPSEPSVEGQVGATVATSVGDIEVVLDADAAPCTVNSFVSLAEQGYFDDTTCHRIIGGFMVQCGDPSASGSGGPGYSYADELTGDERYPEGALAMANSGPDTNGSQFFLVTGDASHLSTHTVFGEVTEESLQILRDIDQSWKDGDNVPVDIDAVTVHS